MNLPSAQFNTTVSGRISRFLAPEMSHRSRRKAGLAKQAYRNLSAKLKNPPPDIGAPLAPRWRGFITFFFRHKKKFLIGFVVVCLGLIVGGHFYQYSIEPTAFPEEVKISNITDQSLTISWLTGKPTFGFVFYSRYQWPLKIGSRIPGLLPRLATWKILPFIEVVPDEHLAFSTVHFVTLNELLPETSYYYQLSAGLHLYQTRLSSDKERKVVLPDIATVAPLKELTTPDPVYGRIFFNDGRTPAAGVIVYLILLQGDEKGESFEPQSFLSDLTDQNGRWLIDRANARTADFKQFFKLGKNDQQFLEAQGGRAGYFDRLIFLGKDKPAPNIRLLLTD